MTTDSPSPHLDGSPVPFFDESAVRRVLHYEDLIGAMERALIDFSAGQVLQPVRSILPSKAHHGFFGIMPAIYHNIMGAKLVTVFPKNAGTGLPTHQAIIVVLNATNGQPVALMDGRLITEMRTAAVSAVATKYLSSPDARKLAILGSGVQARAHYRALQTVRHFDEVCVWSRNPSRAQSLAAEIGATATSAEEAVRKADVVVTVTSAEEPILRGEWLKKGTLVNAVGAVGLTHRELDNSAMQEAVVVDSRQAAAVESADIVFAGVPIYGELGEILAGKLATPSARHVVFKSLGLAVEDLAAASLVLESRAD